ncbi:FAD binding domain-containing protein [Pedobacter sp.]|uniref:FAD binding domain-containing protein n=1 Tax=Pedobacter sp. TaxID=1411316 RepID=UPI003BA90A1F
MRPFKFNNALNSVGAISVVSADLTARYLGGGTNLIDLMKEDVMQPSELVDITRLTNFSEIKKLGKGMSIGAMATNADTANDERIRENYPLLSMAILAGASAQIRNMATNGGNLLQRTRCSYFYDVSTPCNKRKPGSGCSAFQGMNKGHAIFGWSEKCVATHPSDMAIALAALDAVVQVVGPGNAQRNIPFADFHRLPGEQPEIDNNLKHGELITSIHLPADQLAEKSYYLKIRERSSYAFALVSVAAALETNGDSITDVRIALGGVAHKPWRARTAEQWLIGKRPTEANFIAAATAELKNAKPLQHNQYKIGLAGKAISRALEGAMQGGSYGTMEANK